MSYSIQSREQCADIGKSVWPLAIVYYLPNPQGGNPVTYDDCKWTNGILFEIKGERLASLSEDFPTVMAKKNFVDQATRQLAASGERPVVWVFAEEQVARFARELFDRAGLNRITVVRMPWIRSRRSRRGRTMNISCAGVGSDPRARNLPSPGQNS